MDGVPYYHADESKREVREAASDIDEVLKTRKMGADGGVVLFDGDLVSAIVSVTGHKGIGSSCPRFEAPILQP